MFIILIFLLAEINALKYLINSSIFFNITDTDNHYTTKRYSKNIPSPPSELISKVSVYIITILYL